MSWNNPIPWNSRTEPPVPVEGMSSGAANAASVGIPSNNKSLVAGIVSGGASIATAGINYANQQAANHSNERINRENNEYNLRLWNLNNEYNTPANQRRRMEAAGFNPNLMYGSMSPGNSLEPARSESHYNNPPQLADFGTAIGNAYQVYKQSQLLDAEKELKQAQAEDLSIQARLKERSLSNDEKRIEIEKQNLQHSIDELDALKPVYQAQIEKLKSEKRVSDEQADEIFWRNFMNSTTYGYQMERLQAELDKIKAEERLTSKQAYYYTKLAEDCIQDIALGKIELSHAGIRDWYETKMLENDWIMSNNDKKISNVRSVEYTGGWNTAMRYFGAVTGSIGNIVSGNASYQLNPKVRNSSKPSVFSKLHF